MLCRAIEQAPYRNNMAVVVSRQFADLYDRTEFSNCVHHIPFTGETVRGINRPRKPALVVLCSLSAVVVVAEFADVRTAENFQGRPVVGLDVFEGVYHSCRLRWLSADVGHTRQV
jgi:hypothetical protein